MSELESAAPPTVGADSNAPPAPSTPSTAPLAGSHDSNASSPAPARPGRRFQVSVKGLVALIICVASLSWAGRVAYENFWLDATSRTILALRGRDPIARKAAARDLSGAQASEGAKVLRSLVAALKDDDDADVRAEAAQSLTDPVANALLGGAHPAEAKAAVEALFAALDDTHAEVRVTSIRTLNSVAYRLAAKSKEAKSDLLIDKRCEAAFLGMLGDKDEMVREAALRSLGALASRSPSAPPEAVVSTLKDPSSLVRVAAASTLSSYGQGIEPLIPVLLNGIESEKPNVRDAFASALRRVRPPVEFAPLFTESLRSPNRIVRQLSASALGRIGSKAVGSVPELIRVSGEPLSADDLAYLKKPKIMIGGQSSESDDPACVAAKSLSVICPQTETAAVAVASLTDLLKSEHAWRRTAAADALGTFGAAAEPALPTLVAALRDAASQATVPEDGGRCARAIGQIGPRCESDSGDVAALVEALQSKDSDVKTQAAAALGRYGQKANDAIPKLRPLVKDKDSRVRAAAAKALTSLGEKTVLPRVEP
jgi:HEAT repeat protein